jgi:hypothetical protein
VPDSGRAEREKYSRIRRSGLTIILRLRGSIKSRERSGNRFMSAGERVAVESNVRYYARRAAYEANAAAKAVTPEAAIRRQALAEMFARKAQGLCV